MKIIKVAWYVLRVKNIPSLSSLEPWLYWGEEYPSYAHYVIAQGEVKLGILKLTSMFHHLLRISPKHLCVLASLGCTCKVGISCSFNKAKETIQCHAMDFIEKLKLNYLKLDAPFSFAFFEKKQWRHRFMRLRLIINQPAYLISTP